MLSGLARVSLTHAAAPSDYITSAEVNPDPITTTIIKEVPPTGEREDVKAGS